MLYKYWISSSSNLKVGGGGGGGGGGECHTDTQNKLPSKGPDLES